jgi:hypothetical protein
MTEAVKPDPVFVAELAREVSRIVRQRTGGCLSKEGKRELRKMLSSGLTLQGVSSNDLRAQGWTIMQASDVGKIAHCIVDEMLERSKGEWTPSSSSSIVALLRASADGRFCVGLVEPDTPRFKIACRIDDTIHFARITTFPEADIEAMREGIIDWLETAGAELFIWSGNASAFEAAARAWLLGARDTWQ